MSYSRRRLHSRNRREYERKFEEYRDVQPAVIFARNGTIHVPGMPGYIWVHQLGHTASPMAVFKGRAPAFEGLWVWIGRSPKPPFRYQILDVYTAELVPSDLAAATRAQLPLHKQNHEWPSDTEPGIDALPIWQPALQMLKTTGNGDLTVTVNGLTWGDGNRFLGNNAFDLSSHVPATGQLPVLVYFDTAFETLGAVEGTYTEGGDIWQAETVQFPDAPPKAIPSAFVMLSAGQTAITEAHVFDARSFLDVLGREEHPLALDVPTTLTIDELGAIEATTDFHYLEAESGTEDDLETILAAEARQFLLLRAVAGHTITVKHNDGSEEAEGNIFLNGEADFVLTDEKSLLLFYHAPYWTDVGAGGGGVGGAWPLSAVVVDDGPDADYATLADALSGLGNTGHIIVGKRDTADALSDQIVLGGDLVIEGVAGGAKQLITITTDESNALVTSAPVNVRLKNLHIRVTFTGALPTTLSFFRNSDTGTSTADFVMEDCILELVNSTGLATPQMRTIWPSQGPSNGVVAFKDCTISVSGDGTSVATLLRSLAIDSDLQFYLLGLNRIYGFTNTGFSHYANYGFATDDEYWYIPQEGSVDIVPIAGGGGAALTVEEQDGTPTVVNVDTIRVTNGTLTDDGGGQVTLDFGSAATDGSAIHDNEAGEIQAITEKASPASADLILVEDSADLYNKKKVQIGNLPGGGSQAGVLLSRNKTYTYSPATITYHDNADGDTVDDADADWNDSTGLGGKLTDGQLGSVVSDGTWLGWRNESSVVIRLDMEEAAAGSIINVIGLHGASGVWRPIGAHLEYSDNDSSWTTVYNLTGWTPSTQNGLRHWRVQFDISGAGSHRYWRVTLDTSGYTTNYFHFVGEIQLYG